MAKELPYFKFVIIDYFTGDIALEKWELQGIFYAVCAFYWSKNCNLSLELLKKKFDKPKDFKLISKLIDEKIIKTDTNYISISFLNEQWNSKEAQKAINQINGAKGGRPSNMESKSKTESITENKPNGFSFTNPEQTNIDKIKGEERKGDNNKGDSVVFDVIIDQLEYEENLDEPTEQDLQFESEKNKLINDIIKICGFEFPHFHGNQSLISAFVHTKLKTMADIDHFINQFTNYKAYKKLTGEREHSFTSLIGNQKNTFDDGAWNTRNWAHEIEVYQAKGGPTLSNMGKTGDIFSAAINQHRNQNPE